MQIIREKRTDRGFTLLEVMISIAIIAIAFVVLLGLRNNDIAINEYSRNLTMASILAQRKISEIELGGFPDLGETGGDFGQELPGFRWTEIVSPTPFDFAREIRVKVSWKSGGREDDVEFITYMANEQ